MQCKDLIVRPAHDGEAEAVRAVEMIAFGRNGEADLVTALVSSPVLTISLVAECEGKIVGHVLLSEIGGPVRSLALAPLAVLPDYREMLVGTELVRSAIERATEAGFEAMFVLGDPLYYERFGFISGPADRFDVSWQGPHFMALELREGSLKGKSGPLEYPEAFFTV